MLDCFAVWLVKGEVGGGGGWGGDRRDLNQLQSEYLPPGEHLSAFGPRPQVSGYFLKRRFLPPFYR